MEGCTFGFSAERSQFETSKYLRDDVFTIKCTIDVVTYPKGTTNYSLIVPPSSLTPDLVHLLESGQGSDVTFVVKGERFKAHRCVLAARSAIFSAQLFGCVKGKWKKTITIDDMAHRCALAARLAVSKFFDCVKGKWKKTITIDDIEPGAFKSMLYFIYSDALPHFEKQDLKIMAQQLLIAADRYDLERLKLLSADLLRENLDASIVANTLILAERYNCYHLKAKCLEFMSTRKALVAVAATDSFCNLIKSFPTFLEDI
ncbi:BTB/POZ and MATH domain-containing protein 2 [Rhynchospora pubera]|uniref:BTB/POZ and MATH domain-containing protein 2 n=1 Tax=Rhynchospora pubera TaxID=906938 RepID=A0AAV8D8G5_9POAL|nr:BTB/POZ and MATH domain-containing protein 2 [Rhynchospora pubera]